jgi:MiaB/RimO family radical SAM methylthiotransferase
LGVDLPEADLVVEPKNYPLLPGLLTKLFSKISKTGPGTEPGAMPGTPGPFESWPRRLSTPPWRAYLKVAEGCNHKCSYCLIPLLRGPLAVRPLSDLVNEAQILADQGVRELTLVAQDLTAWQEKDLDLGDLVRHLAAISDLKWLRLMYAYPERLSEKLLDKIARTPKVVPYLDLPLQHASMAILKRMGRPAGQILPLIRRLRIRWPQLALRTTFMVGFPGETEKDFEILRQTVEEARFEHLGVFRFEAEDKVRASSFPDQISSAVKKKRQALIMGLQKKISQNLNRARIGAEYEVLTELPAPDSPLIMTGRTPFQAPEVDGVVYFDGEQPMSGQIVRARVIKAGAYDLAVSWTPDEEYFRKKFK